MKKTNNNSHIEKLNLLKKFYQAEMFDYERKIKNTSLKKEEHLSNLAQFKKNRFNHIYVDELNLKIQKLIHTEKELTMSIEINKSKVSELNTRIEKFKTQNIKEEKNKQYENEMKKLKTYLGKLIIIKKHYEGAINDHKRKIDNIINKRNELLKLKDKYETGMLKKINYEDLRYNIDLLVNQEQQERTLIRLKESEFKKTKEKISMIKGHIKEEEASLQNSQ